jgi:hypothetical protein
MRFKGNVKRIYDSVFKELMFNAEYKFVAVEMAFF